MRIIILLLCAWSVPAFAAKVTTFQLDDPSILGQYKLVKADKKSEIQTADLVINSEKNVVVQVDRGVGEYELTAPDKDGVVFSGTDEANCDGDENQCSYDSETIISLTGVKKGSQVIPQLSIKITVSYAWSSDCGGNNENGGDQPACDDEVTTYVLNWDKALENNVSLYTDIEDSELSVIQKECTTTLKGISYQENGPSYSNENSACALPSWTFQYRDTFEKAFPYITDVMIGGNEKQPKEITAKQATAIFAKAEKLGLTYKTKDGVSGKMIAAEIGKIEDLVMKSDRFLVTPAMDDSDTRTKLWAVDSDNKIILYLELQTK